MDCELTEEEIKYWDMPTKKHLRIVQTENYQGDIKFTIQKRYWLFGWRWRWRDAWMSDFFGIYATDSFPTIKEAYKHLEDFK